jgi:hypothetical protein
MKIAGRNVASRSFLATSASLVAMAILGATGNCQELAPKGQFTQMPAETIVALIKRGDELLRIGDISAARLAYERAAAGGSARAMTALGITYDPSFFNNVRGIRPDPAMAAEWYRKAAALGDTAAAPQPPAAPVSKPVAEPKAKPAPQLAAKPAEKPAPLGASRVHGPTNLLPPSTAGEAPPER